MKDSRPEPRLSARVGGVKLSPDSKLALVQFVYDGHGSRSPEREPLKLFDVDTGQELRGFKGLSLDALDFLPSGTQILGRANDGTLTVWDVRIVPVFWKDEGKDEGPAVLPMVRPG